MVSLTYVFIEVVKLKPLQETPWWLIVFFVYPTPISLGMLVLLPLVTFNPCPLFLYPCPILICLDFTILLDARVIVGFIPPLAQECNLQRIIKRSLSIYVANVPLEIHWEIHQEEEDCMIERRSISYKEIQEQLRNQIPNSRNTCTREMHYMQTIDL